jgi:hypothetical protein
MVESSVMSQLVRIAWMLCRVARTSNFQASGLLLDAPVRLGPVSARCVVTPPLYLAILSGCPCRRSQSIGKWEPIRRRKGRRLGKPTSSEDTLFRNVPIEPHLFPETYAETMSNPADEAPEPGIWVAQPTGRLRIVITGEVGAGV